MSLHYVAFFAEDEFVHLEVLGSSLEAQAYARGCTEGASHYGAGACAAYALPLQDFEMRQCEEAAQCARVDEERAERAAKGGS
jgi:hypothetical protein